MSKMWPERYISRRGVFYVYDCKLVDTNYGPENQIKLSKEGNWRTGPHVELSECMKSESLADLAIDQLIDEMQP